jgi:hypothetical protein
VNCRVAAGGADRCGVVVAAGLLRTPPATWPQRSPARGLVVAAAAPASSAADAGRAASRVASRIPE